MRKWCSPVRWVTNLAKKVPKKNSCSVFDFDPFSNQDLVKLQKLLFLVNFHYARQWVNNYYWNKVESMLISKRVIYLLFLTENRDPPRDWRASNIVENSLMNDFMQKQNRVKFLSVKNWENALENWFLFFFSTIACFFFFASEWLTSTSASAHSKKTVLIHPPFNSTVKLQWQSIQLPIH